jgi:hypothetical protein
LAKAKNTGEIGCENVTPVGKRVINGGRAASDAGVVDKDVNGVESRYGLVNELRSAVWLAEVGGERDVLNAGFADCSNYVRWNGLRCMKCNVGAGLRERDCDGCAHSAR